MIENKIQTEVKKSRRGLPRHTKNPFLNDTSLHTKTGVRRITTGKDRLALVNESTGEQVGNGGFWICPYISRHLLSLNPLQARCRRYSRGER